MASLILQIFFLAVTLATSQGSPLSHYPLQMHLLRSKWGSGGHHVPGMSCLSWRLAVETNNKIGWSTVPEECEDYVGHYMLGSQYREDSAVITDEAFAHAKTFKLAGDGKDIWVFDVDETTLSNLPYYAKHGFGAEPYNSTAFNQWVFTGEALALPESLKLYRKLLSIGIKVVFLTGRSEDQKGSDIKQSEECWVPHLGEAHTQVIILFREDSGVLQIK
uniref:Acid phosphatase 1-like n=1 Tax=Populus alba TaxID=43335 RepID=A0A4U5MXY9_POPAL|nr:hypothetical protein D5086_0000290430 [Populus alba]